MGVVAKFPASIWDGTSPSRTTLDEKYPTSQDYDRLAAEIIALQNHVIALKSAIGAITMVPLSVKGTDPATVTIGDLFTIVTKDIITAIGASAVASVDTTYSIPVGSLVLAVATNIESAVTLSTAVKIGIGYTGAIDTYGLLLAATKNTQTTNAITPTAIATAQDIKVYACATDGTAAGTIQNGSVRIRIVMLQQAALPTA